MRIKVSDLLFLFQHTAARRRLAFSNRSFSVSVLFQHTAARRRLVQTWSLFECLAEGFNTQPPEGGWVSPI